MIVKKSPEEIDRMAAAGDLLVRTMNLLAGKIRPGVTTQELDEAAERFIRSQGAVPSFKGYRGFPGSICASPNAMIVHGIPGPYRLAKGDILSVDIGVTLDGWVADAARTFAVGPITPVAEKLLDVTRESLMLAVSQCVPGNRLGDIGHAIQRHAEAHRYGVVRDFCGHGVGRVFHDAPEVVHVGKPGTGPELKPGMIFTIEPMVNIGRPDVKMLDDGWTAVTRDRSLSAQFEHSVGITETGCEIFTKSPAGADKPPYA